MSAPTLRDRIAAALRSTPSSGWTYTPGQEKWDHHRRGDQPGHRYSITCALCVGDIYALADAVLPLVAAELRDAADELTADANALDALPGPLENNYARGMRAASDRLRARADAAHATEEPRP